MVAIPSKLTTIRKKEGDGDEGGIWRTRGIGLKSERNAGRSGQGREQGGGRGGNLEYVKGVKIQLVPIDLA